ncbi:MAG: tetratricopeptide repeat protein [Deltaproteobacteria bacterium]
MIAAALLAALVGAAPPSTLGAREAYEVAVKYFSADEAQLALPYFRRAYEASSHRPSTILGLAQCERVLGRYDDALEHLNEFLATEPDDLERRRAEETIVMIEALRATVTSSSATGPPPPPSEPTLVAEPVEAPPERASPLSSPWLWIIVGAVVVTGAGVAVAIGTSGSSPYGGNTGIIVDPDA